MCKLSLNIKNYETGKEEMESKLKKYILLYEPYLDLTTGVKYRITYEDSNNYYYYKTDSKTIVFSKSDENKKFKIGDITS